MVPPASNKMKINFFRHSFFKISCGEKNILVDPYTRDDSSERAAFKPLVKCPPLKDALKNTDMILITHEHFDHFEKDTIEKIAKNNNCFVVGHESVLNKLDLPQTCLKSVNGFDKIDIKGVNIDCYPAHHHNSFYPLSYLMTIGNKSVFHAGDTSLVEMFSKIKSNVAILPVGGAKMTMDVVDAVRAIKMMKPDYAIPMHYDTFEQIKADPREFKHKIEKSILKTKAVILQPGGCFSF